MNFVEEVLYVYMVMTRVAQSLVEGFLTDPFLS